MAGMVFFPAATNNGAFALGFLDDESEAALVPAASRLARLRREPVVDDAWPPLSAEEGDDEPSTVHSSSSSSFW